jgi:hypothetical protein
MARVEQNDGLHAAHAAKRLSLLVCVFVLLTLLTQIGGPVWLMALAGRRLLRLQTTARFLLLFLSLYIAATYATHVVAPAFGRVPLACFAGDTSFAVQSPFFCALNRNYVRPEVEKAAQALAAHMDVAFPGTKTLALDGNFPFIDGFPLIPHLSHNDGRKLDIAFYYKDDEGNFLNGKTRSPIGYFAFQKPLPNAPLPCAGRNRWLSLRWDLAFLQPFFPDWQIEEKRAGEAISWLSTSGAHYGVERIFVEPHLQAELGVSGGRIRFQGCNAARHDDHIHFQVR